MKKRALIFIVLAALLYGCASSIEVGKHPLIVSQAAGNPIYLPIHIGLVKIDRPMLPKAEYEDTFLLHLTNAIEAGMLAACRLIDPHASLVEPGADVDLLLIPSNPFFQIGKGTYDLEVTLSMDVRVIQKGVAKERGFLVEAIAGPGPARPVREVKLLGETWGLIGERIAKSKLERAINQTLFDFSVQFAEKTAKRAERYVITKGLATKPTRP